MPEFIEVAKTSDIPPGSVKCVESKGHRIAIFNIDGEMYATQESCTHAEASLCDGEVTGEEVMCPLHFATFNVKTGECTGPPADEDLMTYRVRIEGDAVEVEI